MRNWIPLARVAREHGLTKGETSYLRCDLLQVGGFAFESAPIVAFSANIDGPSFDSLNISEPIKPLGGKWGQAKAVIIPIPKNRKWTRGEWISVPRESFPKVSDNEFYLCDLMGLAATTEVGFTARYRVFGIEDRSRGANEAIALILRDLKTSRTFETPLKCVDWSLSTQELLVIPTLEDWRDLA